MLLPSPFVVKPHDQLQILLADVIAMVEDVKTTQGVCVFGRCYSHVWLMELPQVSIYFKFSSEMLSRTSYHMCGRWYLPIFLFRDGLLTLMYKASVISLRRFWSSLPNMEKLSMVTECTEVLIWSCMYRRRGQLTQINTCIGIVLMQ